jgi:hypothetical protein
VILAAQVRGALPMLVICPRTVAWAGWVKEIGKVAPHLRVGVALSTAAQRKKVFAAALAGQLDVVVTGYESMRSHTKFAHYGSKDDAG